VLSNTVRERETRALVKAVRENDEMRGETCALDENDQRKVRVGCERRAKSVRRVASGENDERKVCVG
jgi:hypothetical protein